jgi:hypothetical protein
MGYVVTLRDITPAPRVDGLPWTQATIGEAGTAAGPFSTIATIPLSPLDTDPSRPQPRSFTTANATLSAGWYLVTFLDAAGDQQPTTAVPYPPPEPAATTSYCSVLDVQSRNAARPVSASSVPNLAQVGQMIGDAAAELNAILVNKGYEIPVNSASSPDAFAVLHSMNVTGAWAMMEAAAPNSPNLDRAAAAWTAAKKMLADAQFVLNAPQDVQRAEPRGPWVTTQPTGRVYDPTFSHGNCPDSRARNPYFSRSQRF